MKIVTLVLLVGVSVAEAFIELPELASTMKNNNTECIDISGAWEGTCKNAAGAEWEHKTEIVQNKCDSLVRDRFSYSFGGTTTFELTDSRGGVYTSRIALQWEDDNKTAMTYKLVRFTKGTAIRVLEVDGRASKPEVGKLSIVQKLADGTLVSDCSYLLPE